MCDPLSLREVADDATGLAPAPITSGTKAEGVAAEAGGPHTTSEQWFGVAIAGGSTRERRIWGCRS